jgi:sRNA-binding regulator protein Hfq
LPPGLHGRNLRCPAFGQPAYKAVAREANLGYDTNQYLKAKQAQAAAENAAASMSSAITFHLFMANSSQIPVTGLSGFRSEALAKRSPAKLRAVPTATPDAQESEPADSTALPVTGPRKLVRPTLPGRSFRNRAFNMHEEPAILAHQTMGASAHATESSHAEAFYFQKQMQGQIPMIVVLDNGEQIEGCIEWYDHNAIKIKGSTRMLVYKAAIKYIYKAPEKHV